MLRVRNSAIVRLTFTSCSLPVFKNKMSNDLNEIAAWLKVNKLTLNLLKTGCRQRIATLDGNIELSLLRLPYTFRWTIFFKSGFLGQNIGRNVISNLKKNY